MGANNENNRIVVGGGTGAKQLASYVYSLC